MIGCTHFPACSGCVYKSIKKAPEIYEQAAKFFSSTCKLDLHLTAGSPTGYRTRAKLAVRHNANDPKKPLIGLFEKDSHKVMNIPKCKVHHPAINEAVARILGGFTLTAYNEESHTGDLRYLQLVVERRTGKVQLVFVLNCDKKKLDGWRAFAQKLAQDPLWHSIWINCNEARTNAIFGPYWEKCAGSDVVWETLADLEIPFGPAHFSQSNLEMYNELLLDISDGLPENLHAVELYAGIGTIGLSIAKKCKSLALSEVQPDAKPFFDLAYERLPLALQKRVSYEVLSAEDSEKLLIGKDTCIVDPPRKGLGPRVLEQIFSTPTLKRVVYVSCDYLSLERDLRHLFTHFPNWKVKDALSYLFFPGTNQIETVVFLQKKKSAAT